METYEDLKFLNYIGWAGVLSLLGFTDEEINECEKADEEAMEAAREREKHYFENLPNVKNAITEFKKGFPDEWKNERRVEFLKQRSEEYEQKLVEAQKSYATQFKNDSPYWIRQMSQEKIIRIVNHLKSLKSELRYRQSGKGNGITPDMIIRAKEYPLENLVEANHQKALCPFHDDKNPSMWIKKNFYYCFSCSANGDVIDFVMRRDGLSFQEAVKKLS